ncbi:MAG: tRNA (N(6)-L-threonylcarbamoyladenosine(37)-C(2))-methylthiotransferase MtaB [Anaerolineales bacterium]|nr:tRNA (N(6)-L-threonylcarbamoyladenosine(37)-C(2))-methylthiotransferase MtaB [Anaerolineales bacterium]
MRIRLDAIGCRLNSGEMDALARAFAAVGHCVVPSGEDADLVVFNSCTVTHRAAADSRRAIRKLRRKHARAALVVTGCYAQLSAQAVRALGADLVIGNQKKDALPQLLHEAGLLAPKDPLPTDTIPMAGVSGRTRAFLKVQDGCDNRCAFCIVTLARGRARSRAQRSVIADINRLVGLGYHEVVLCGVHLGAYGHDWGDMAGLEKLLMAVLAETDITRLRLSSLEPWDLQPAFFRLWENARLLPHLHLPLQSGCECTLRRMGRRTTCASFRELLQVARSTISDLAVSTDMMVGFPGESAAEFQQSLQFAESMAFVRMHIFRYSRRAGTLAVKMPAQVPASVAKQRSRRLHSLDARMQTQFRRRFVGRKMDVLWERAQANGDRLSWSGLTPNYLRVVTDTDGAVNLHNAVTETAMLAAVEDGLLGEVQPGPAPVVSTPGSALQYPHQMHPQTVRQ